MDDVYDIDDAGESGAAASWPVGRPVRIEQNTDADAEVTTRIAYDHEGRVTRRRVAIDTLPDKDIFYNYDPSRKVISLVYPGRFTLSQAYDAVGNVTSQNYRRAATEALKTASYTYDGLHRLKSVSLGAPPAPGPTPMTTTATSRTSRQAATRPPMPTHAAPRPTGWTALP